MMRRLLLSALLFCPPTQLFAALGGIVPLPNTASPATCVAGTGTSAPSGLILPPTVAAPSAGGDVVGLILQNNSVSDQTLQYMTFGQVFHDGDLATTDGLQVRANSTNYPAQLDVISTWGSGKVKIAAVTIGAANVCASTNAAAMLNKVSPSGSPVTITPLALSVTLTCSANCTTQTINLGSALATYLAGSPTYFLHGSLASQVRYDTGALTGSATMHITVDLTQYADGTQIADVQFNDDITAGASGGAAPALPGIAYTAATTFNGHTKTFSNLTQYQYSDWHELLRSDGVDLTDNPPINVQYDVGYLEYAGAILPYDRTTGVNYSLISTTWPACPYGGTGQSFQPGTPLSIQCLAPDEGGTGGRFDLGWMTQYETAWALTQTALAAQWVLALGDSAGTATWNTRLASTGHWMTTLDDPAIFTGGNSTSSLTLGNLPNSAAPGVGIPANQHQVELAYLPWLMTAERWYLDRVNAFAAWSVSDNYMGGGTQPGRCNSQLGCTGFTNGSGDQWNDLWFQDMTYGSTESIRGGAWNARDIGNACLVGLDGSWEKTYFCQVMSDNWTHFTNVNAGTGYNGIPPQGSWSSTSYQGQLAGAWYQSVIVGTGHPSEANVILDPWMMDYLTGVVAHLSLFGDAGATNYLSYQASGWIPRRFNVPNVSNDPLQCCNYNLYSTDQSANSITTWAAELAYITNFGPGSPCEDALCTALTFGSGGDYIWEARGMLGAVVSALPNTDPNYTNVQGALSWMDNASPLSPSGAQCSTGGQCWPPHYKDDPTWNVVPLQSWP